MNSEPIQGRSILHYRRLAQAGAFCACLGGSAYALAQEEKTQPETSPLGLAPGVPQVSALPGGFTPAYSDDGGEGDWQPDFHGFINMPLRLGINRRQGPVTSEQYSTVLHAPPVVPEYRDAFTYTGSLPDPYVQLHFAYGNSVVTANVILQARQAVTAMSFFDASTRGGISDAFLTFNLPDLAKNSRVQVHVGAFTNRYGAMGEYDEGRYGTPIIARTNGVGENFIAQFALGDWALEVQHGFQGQLDKAPMGIVPGDWNEYADPNLGTGLVHHAHAGLGYLGQATLGLHYMMAWSQDERASHSTIPDGRIHVLGADVRYSMKRFGHLYLGAAHTNADNARSVGRVIEVLNTFGGPGLMRNYLGPDSGGTGQLFTLGGQYDLSIGRLLYGSASTGKGPDIVLSLFGMQTQVSSEDTDFDGVTKRKFGTEVGYSLLSWLATSARVDHVQADVDEPEQSFSILSPRLIFRSDWKSRDQVVLQYSHYMYGDDVTVRTGTPPVDDPTVNPDEGVISLSASMWW